jgi:acetyl esterase/lipase
MPNCAQAKGVWNPEMEDSTFGRESIGGERTNMSTEKNTDRFAVTSNVPAQSSTPPRRAKTPAERVMPPVVYRLPGMDTARVHSNLKYSDVENPYLLMDIYTPPKLSKDEHRPVVVCIHGGAGAQYKPKDWGFYQSWGRLIAAAGMVGVTFTHRLGYPKPFLSDAAADVSKAIDYVREHADSLNADRDRVCLAAWSAGGPLLTTAMREKPTFVRCMVAFYAYLDCQQSQSHADNESPASVKAFSPITYFQGDPPSMIPIFVARAGQDEIPTMNDSIDRFMAAAIAVNAPVTFMNHPFGEHGFDNQNDDERSREIIRSAIAFMHTHLQ